MHSISKCDNNINLLHFIFFFYISKLALLFAQQCQDPISQTGFLHSFAAAFHLHDFKK